MHKMLSLTLSLPALCALSLLACDESDDAGATASATATTTTSTGGSGGSSTSTSAGGSASGGSGGGGGQPVGSDGCGEMAVDPPETWVEKTIDVGGNPRLYYLWLPANYDPMRPYPVVYQFHGCSTNPNRQDNNPPVQAQSGADAIHIRGRALADCWDAAADGPDVAYFDALVPVVEASWCADLERRLATGYSSGSFMTHRLSCIRGDMLRGVASIAGGQAGNNCVGKTAALLIHDDTDGTVNISASESARDRHLTNNGCDAQAATTPTNHPPCEAYAGCDAGLPVVWCQTTGMGHARQDSLSAPAFWDFLSAL